MASRMRSMVTPKAVNAASIRRSGPPIRRRVRNNPTAAEKSVRIRRPSDDKRFCGWALMWACHWSAIPNGIGRFVMSY